MTTKNRNKIQSDDVHTREIPHGSSVSAFELLIEANPRYEKNGHAKRKDQSCTDLNCKIISKNWIII